MMQFSVRQYYTREEIRAELRGEIQSYLPQHGGHISCRLFWAQSLNPDAPLEVQAGKEPKVVRKAETLAAQSNKRIPIFLKGTPERPRSPIWQYQGEYELCELVDDAAVLEIAGTHSGRRGLLSYLLRFRSVDRPADLSPNPPRSSGRLTPPLIGIDVVRQERAVYYRYSEKSPRWKTTWQILHLQEFRRRDFFT